MSAIDLPGYQLEYAPRPCLLNILFFVYISSLFLFCLFAFRRSLDTVWYATVGRSSNWHVLWAG